MRRTRDEIAGIIHAHRELKDVLLEDGRHEEAAEHERHALWWEEQLREMK